MSPLKYRLSKGFPSFLTRMMVGEDEQAIVLEDAVALAEDDLEFGCETFGIGILDFAGLRVVECALPRPRHQLLPGEKEIRKLGIMDVVKERRVCHNEVNALIRHARVGGIAAGQVDAMRREVAVFGPSAFDLPGEGLRAHPGRAAVSAANSRRSEPVVDRPQQAAAKQARKEPELFGVPQTLASIGVRSGLRMWWENMCRTAPVPSPLYDANMLLNSRTPENNVSSAFRVGSSGIWTISLRSQPSVRSCLSLKKSRQIVKP